MITFINLYESNPLESLWVRRGLLKDQRAFTRLLVFKFLFSGSNEHVNNGIGVLRSDLAVTLEPPAVYATLHMY